MRSAKITAMLILASTLAFGVAGAQEADVATDTEATPAEHQKPDRDRMRQHRHDMTDAERAARRERWESMSDEERQAARQRTRNRHAGRGCRHGHPPGPGGPGGPET